MDGRISDDHVDLSVFMLYVIRDIPQGRDITYVGTHGLLGDAYAWSCLMVFVQLVGRCWNSV